MSKVSIWGCAEVVVAAPATAAPQFTSNGNDFAAVPTDGGLAFDADQGPTSLTQVLSFRVPIDVTGRSLIGYVQNITFGVSRTPDVRVSVVAELAGTVKVVEFDYENSTAPAQNDPLRIVRVFSPQGLEAAGGGQLGLPGPVADYTATITVSIQRRSAKGRGSVQIQALDVSAVLAPPVGKTN